MLRVCYHPFKITHPFKNIFVSKFNIEFSQDVKNIGLFLLSTSFVSESKKKTTLKTKIDENMISNLLEIDFNYFI